MCVYEWLTMAFLTHPYWSQDYEEVIIPLLQRLVFELKPLEPATPLREKKEMLCVLYMMHAYFRSIFKRKTL